MSNFVSQELGDAFVSLPPTSLVDVFASTSKNTPIIFILSTGADPTSVLLRFAAERKFDERLGVISLGQGQGCILKLVPLCTYTVAPLAPLPRLDRGDSGWRQWWWSQW